MSEPMHYESYGLNNYDVGRGEKEQAETWFILSENVIFKKTKISNKYSQGQIEVTEIHLPNRTYTVKGWFDTPEQLLKTLKHCTL